MKGYGQQGKERAAGLEKKVVKVKGVESYVPLLFLLLLSLWHTILKLVFNLQNNLHNEAPANETTFIQDALKQEPVS